VGSARVLVAGARVTLAKPSGAADSREAGVSEMTHEEALRQAESLVALAVKDTEGRCGVLAQFVHDCEASGSRTSAWSEAFRELRALHSYRIRLKRRHSLIQQALESSVGECPAQVPLGAQPNRDVARIQRQVQVRPQRHS
jgi:hypothetical protein